MRVFREPQKWNDEKDALTFAVGAIGGLALGLLMSRREAPRPVGRLGTDLRERARTVGDRARSAARRLRPERLRRVAREQTELTQLEDAVLDAFLADGILSERGVDVGAISPGIIELSGSVWTEEEADRAVEVARAVSGVHTVVNRMDIESEARQLDETRRRLESEGSGITSMQHGTARTGGMGLRRQGRETESRSQDDSRHIRMDALKSADQNQWEDEGLAWKEPRSGERPEVQRAARTNYEEDELSNQDPHNKHAKRTLDAQPQQFNSDARVGEGLKPGTELGLEGADVPVKPHSRQARDVGPTSEEP